MDRLKTPAPFIEQSDEQLEKKPPVTFPHLDHQITRPPKSSFILLSSSSDRWHLAESPFTPLKLVLYNRRKITDAILKDYPTPRPVSAFETKLPNLTGWVGGRQTVPSLTTREFGGVTVSIPEKRYTTAKESRVMHLSGDGECSDMFTYMRKDQERRVKSEGGNRFRAGITRNGRVGAESRISGALFGIDACRGLMTV
jgi:hypothetical protein